MPFNLGGPELIIVLVIVLIVFGAGKLPNVMRDFGRGVKEFKKAQTEEELQEEAAAKGQAAPPVTPVSASNTATVNGAGSTHTTAPAPETAQRA
jgi:sec-independent protein translocase protein TatA